MKLNEYPVNEFGEKQGQSLIKDITKECTTLEKLCIGENAANAKTMRTKIFPSVAMYHALQKTMSKQKACGVKKASRENVLLRSCGLYVHIVGLANPSIKDNNSIILSTRFSSILVHE